MQKMRQATPSHSHYTFKHLKIYYDVLVFESVYYSYRRIKMT